MSNAEKKKTKVTTSQFADGGYGYFAGDKPIKGSRGNYTFPKDGVIKITRYIELCDGSTLSDVYEVFEPSIVTEDDWHAFIMHSDQHPVCRAKAKAFAVKHKLNWRRV